MSPATLIEVSQMLSKLHDTSYINIRATPEPALNGEILPLHFIQGQNDRSEGLRMTISEGALNDNEKGRNDRL